MNVLDFKSMFSALKKRMEEKASARTAIRYFFRYWTVFLVLLLISFTVGYVFGDRQLITETAQFNHWSDFIDILKRNTLVFGYILLSVYTSKINVYIMVIFNGILVGTIISRFAHTQYLIMLLPHGILEMSVFFMLGAIVSKYVDKKETNWRTLIKSVSILYIVLIAAAVIEAWVTPFLTVKYCYGL